MRNNNYAATISTIKGFFMVMRSRFSSLLYWSWRLILVVFAFGIPSAYAQDIGILSTNQTLSSDQVLRSSNKAYWAAVQSNGQLVVFTQYGKAVWSTYVPPSNGGSLGSLGIPPPGPATGAAANGRMVMLGDGRLCIYVAQGVPPVSCIGNERNPSDYFLILRDSGDLEIYNGTPANTGAAVLVWTSMLDVNYYGNRYADLKQAFGTDGRALMYHWLMSGRLEGRSPRNGISDEGFQHVRSTTLDSPFYANKYPDLKQAFGYDPEKLYQHWMTYGMKEGRIPNKPTEDLLAAPPRSANGLSVMRFDDWLREGEYMRSDNKRFIAALQPDANLVVYETSSPAGANGNNRRWYQNSSSFPIGKYIMRLRKDGHMCTYPYVDTAGPRATPVGGEISCTPSGPAGPVGRYFVGLQDDGNLVIYKGNGPFDTRGYVWDYITTRPSSGFNWNAVAEAVSTFVVSSANTVASGTTGAANTVAAGSTQAANDLAREATAAAQVTAAAAQTAANTVAHTAVDVANQTANIANSVIDMIRGNCSTYSKYFPDPLNGIQGVTALAQAINSQVPNPASGEVVACAEAFRSAYYCQIPEEVVSLVKDVKAIPDILQVSAEQSITQECVGSFALTATGFVQAPLVCGALKSMVQDSIKVSKCAAAAARAGILQQLMISSGDGGSTQAQACSLAGKYALKAAKMTLTKAIPAGTPAQMLYSTVTRTGAASMAITQLAQLAECGGSGAPASSPVQVQAAWYGVEGQPVWEMGGKSVAVRIREGMQNGQVVIPANMNGFFGGDPIPGKAKVVAVQVVYQGQVLNLRQAEGKDLRFPGTLGTDYYLGR
jgi:hypothetical protein